MIKPSSYWTLLQTADAETIGRISLAIAGREAELDAPLSPAEKALVTVIQQEIELMEDRAEAIKQKWARQKKGQRKAEQAADRAAEAQEQRAGIAARGTTEKRENAKVNGEGLRKNAKCPPMSTPQGVDKGSVHPPKGGQEECPPMSTPIHSYIHTYINKPKGLYSVGEANRAREGSGERPATVPTDEEARQMAVEARVPEGYLGAFMAEIAARGWGYAKNGEFVPLNRRNFKAILRAWYLRDEKAKKAAMPEGMTLQQEGYDGSKLGI